jgi:hypothetical protein
MMTIIILLRILVKCLVFSLVCLCVLSRNISKWVQGWRHIPSQLTRLKKNFSLKLFLFPDRLCSVEHWLDDLVHLEEKLHQGLHLASARRPCGLEAVANSTLTYAIEENKLIIEIFRINSKFSGKRAQIVITSSTQNTKASI